MRSQTRHNNRRSTLPRRYAFFDVDGTLLPFKSLFDFQAHYFGRSRAPAARLQYLALRARFAFYALTRRDREFVNRRYCESFRGRRAEDVARKAEAWFARRRAEHGVVFVPATLELLNEHRRAGVGIVLVSGSLRELLVPVARALGGAEIIATRLEAVEGICTGRILGPPMIGRGKGEVVANFLRARGVDPRRCFAYGDHWSDVEMLEAVGRPGVLAGDKRLEGHAQRRGWLVITAKTI